MSTLSNNNRTMMDHRSYWERVGYFWWDHPRTLLLGGFVAYVGYGLTMPVGSRKRRAYFRPIAMPLSGILTLVGFAVNMVDDIRDAIRDGRTKIWQQCMNALVQFLEESGLEDEFSATMNSSLFLPSLMVLTDVQNKVQRERRANLRQNKPIEPQDLRLGQHYMRYATAVYGPEMIASTQLAVDGEVQAMPDDSNHDFIAKHCKLNLPPKMEDAEEVLKEEREWEIWCDFTRDPTSEENNHGQHCLVVCDHKTKTVILSIRGTFSVSGIVTDLAGYCDEFCGGFAHSGMAIAARATWESIWDEFLEKKLQTLPLAYNVVVTGHSLGGGVACLVTVLMYHEVANNKLPALKGRRIQCYAMAPPPVFGPLSAAPEAVANTVGYIHSYDCVPSLSVDGVRRLMACVGRIAEVLGKHPTWELATKRWELGEPNPELVEAYKPKEAMRELQKAPMIFIPARQLIWLEHVNRGTGLEPKYEAHALDPTFYADRIFDLELPDCVSNHMAPEYETAFLKVLGAEFE